MTHVPTDPEGRPLYPAGIADLDPAKVFAAGLHLPVRVVQQSSGRADIGIFFTVWDHADRPVAHVWPHIGPRPFSAEAARGIATAIAKAINTLGASA